MGVYTNSWSETLPVGTDPANQLDDYIRVDTKAALGERIAIEHQPLDSVEAGANDSDNANAQGRHVPGIVGVMLYAPRTTIDALDPARIGDGALAYDTTNNSFLVNRKGAGGWTVFSLTTDTILPDNETLEIIANVIGMKHDNQQWTTTFELTDGATINTDCNNSNSFKVTLGGNRTLANPTNPKEGATYIWKIKQDVIGSRTLAFGSNFKFPGGIAPILTTAVGSVDIVSSIYIDGVFLTNVIYDVR